MSEPRIHPTALVSKGAELDSSVEIGAYSLVGPKVRIGAGTVVGPHCVIEGQTTIGRDNRFFSSARLERSPKTLCMPRSMRISPLNSSSGIETRFASSAPSIAALLKKTASPASVQTTGLWPMCTSRMIARWATTRSWPTKPRWLGMCMSAIGR